MNEAKAIRYCTTECQGYQLYHVVVYMYIRILDIINFFIWDIKKKVFKVKNHSSYLYL